MAMRAPYILNLLRPRNSTQEGDLVRAIVRGMHAFLPEWAQASPSRAKAPAEMRRGEALRALIRSPAHASATDVQTLLSDTS